MKWLRITHEVTYYGKTEDYRSRELAEQVCRDLNRRSVVIPRAATVRSVLRWR